ncbi:MAG: hypothetical protein F4093_04545 [Gammaproteobacteria bacterium]|nr:hypothetical protein [Gammaproteobacteria bacterium]
MSDLEQDGLIRMSPVTLLKARLPDCERINPEILKLIRAYREAHPGTAVGSYVSPDNFSGDIENPALDALKTFIMDSVYDIARHLNHDSWRRFGIKDIRIDVTGLWFQICNDSAFHETHVHGNCSWSGVYYVQSGNASRHNGDRLPNGMLNGVTRFYGPDLEHSAGGHGDWGNVYLHDHHATSYPQDGTLVVFPAHLKHMAFPYRGEADRVIVSFHAQVNGTKSIEYNYGFD